MKFFRSTNGSEMLLNGVALNALDPATFSIVVPDTVSYASALFPLAAVPEPAPAALLLVGLAAIGGLVLRRSAR